MEDEEPGESETALDLISGQFISLLHRSGVGYSSAEFHVPQ